ncbi:MAG: LytR C-terminal domain-containing protein [Actinobacteria bacterium]|nr:LytR C-terminal domain-containing protein [Actinomycetota bacterium]
MRIPPEAHRSLACRVFLLVALVAVAVACSSSSSTNGTAPSTTTSSTTTSSTTSTTSTTTTLPPTTTTTIPLVFAPGVVKVANASGVNGAAGFLSDELAALGFQTRKATNAAGPDEDLQTSKIYVIGGSEPVAESVSRLMGGIEVLRMPTPAWITGGTAGLEDATVLVMLGHDLAGKKLAEMAG